MSKKRISIANIIENKGEAPLVCLTSYTAPVTKIIDDYADIILVGDSLGMVIYGMDTTLNVTIDMMINHGKAVVNSSEKSCIVVDMPFGTYEKSKEDAFENAARIMSETGCNAVKIEGGIEMQETINFLTKRGIPVMAHIGLMPQMIMTYNGYKTHGKDDQARNKILKDAESVELAGAFSVVVEAVTESLANEITEKVNIPVIGIGASNRCDGQILVTEDMIGMFTDFKPKFVKRYGNIADNIKKSVKDFADDVKSRDFPTESNVVK